METSQRIRRVRLSVMLVAGVAALAAGLLAFMWWKAEPAKAVTDPGKIVFINASTSDIYLMSPDGSDVTRVAERPGLELYPILSPDGKKIAFLSSKSGEGYETYVMNVDGTGEVNVSKNGSTPEYSPSWSPDGSKVAYGFSDDIFTANADGSGTPDNVTNSARRELYPSWSPDGRKFAFLSETPDNNSGDIYVMNADGSGTPVQLTDTGNHVNESHPSWSADGSKIAYERHDPNSGWHNDIYKMNADGTDETLVVGTEGWETMPSWSPDGTQLVFSAYSGPYGSDGEIIKVNADGSGQTPLTDNTVWDNHASWGSSGASDTTPPVLTLPQDITEEAAGADGSSVTFTPTAEDDVDGTGVPVICASASGLTSGDTFPLGTTQVDCSATDAAGNTANGSFNVNVIYGWSGVLQPINGGTTLNDYSDDTSSFRLGSTVPVTFKLSGASAGITDATAKLLVAKVSDNVTGTEENADSTAAATEGNLFRYDATSDQYVFNWGTRGLEVGTYELRIDLGDGTRNTVRVSLH